MCETNFISLVLSLTAVLVFGYCNASEILVAFPTQDDYSTMMMAELSIALSTEGHSVTVLPPMKNSKLKLVKGIATIDIPQYESKFKINWFELTKTEIDAIRFKLIEEARTELRKILLDHSVRQTLSKIKVVVVPMDQLGVIEDISVIIPEVILVTVCLDGNNYDKMSQISGNLIRPAFSDRNGYLKELPSVKFFFSLLTTNKKQ